MFFLLRCAFWLGLTFWMMNWPGGAPTLPDPGSLVQSATGQIAHACLDAPQACLDGARKIEALRASLPNAITATAEPAPAIAATPAASPRVVPLPPVAPTRLGANTLRASDFLPTWRGRG
jgi:hypothetical protein